MPVLCSFTVVPVVRVNTWSLMHVNPCVQVLVMSGAISALKTASHLDSL